MSVTPNLAKALLAFQAEAPALQRDKINPAFKSKYLSLEKLLEEVLPTLSRAGLAVSQWPTFVKTETGVLPALRTRLVHAESGEQWEDTMLILPAKSDPQGQGSAITYAKRYALCAALGLSADEDDDGNKASGGAAKKRPAAAKLAAEQKSSTTITAEQRAKLFATARDHGWTTEAIKETVKRIAEVDSTNDIPKAKFTEVLAALSEQASG